jgi:hypothetical protein
MRAIGSPCRSLIQFDLYVYQGVLMTTFLGQITGKLGATVTGTTSVFNWRPSPNIYEKRRLQMNKFRFTINLLAIAIFTLAFATMAQAQASRTWVSGVGDDANPCSRTAPCKTFAGAISKTAMHGEINALDDGGFGALTITKSITIEGGGHIAGVLASGTSGIIINITAAPATDPGNVTLRNLDINGFSTGTFGVRILAAQRVVVDNCVIYGFRSTLGGSNGRGISDERTAASPIPMLWVTNCDVRNNIGGIAATGGSALRVHIDNTRVSGQTSIGVFVNGGAKVSIRSSQVSGNASDGIHIETAGTEMMVVGSLVANNQGVGLNNLSGSQFSVADTTVVNNVTGVSGTLVSFGNNNVRNNTGGNALPPAVGQQ